MIKLLSNYFSISAGKHTSRKLSNLLLRAAENSTEENISNAPKSITDKIESESVQTIESKLSDLVTKRAFKEVEPSQFSKDAPTIVESATILASHTSETLDLDDEKQSNKRNRLTRERIIIHSGASEHFITNYCLGHGIAVATGISEIANTTFGQGSSIHILMALLYAMFKLRLNYIIVKSRKDSELQKLIKDNLWQEIHVTEFDRQLISVQSLRDVIHSIQVGTDNNQIDAKIKFELDEIFPPILREKFTLNGLKSRLMTMGFKYFNIPYTSAELFMEAIVGDEIPDSIVKLLNSSNKFAFLINELRRALYLSENIMNDDKEFIKVYKSLANFNFAILQLHCIPTAQMKLMHMKEYMNMSFTLTSPVVSVSNGYNPSTGVFKNINLVGSNQYWATLSVALGWDFSYTQSAREEQVGMDLCTAFKLDFENEVIASRNFQSALCSMVASREGATSLYNNSLELFLNTIKAAGLTLPGAQFRYGNKTYDNYDDMVSGIESQEFDGPRLSAATFIGEYIKSEINTFNEERAREIRMENEVKIDTKSEIDQNENTEVINVISSNQKSNVEENNIQKENKIKDERENLSIKTKLEELKDKSKNINIETKSKVKSKGSKVKNKFKGFGKQDKNLDKNNSYKEGTKWRIFKNPN